MGKKKYQNARERTHSDSLKKFIPEVSNLASMEKVDAVLSSASASPAATVTGIQPIIDDSRVVKKVSASNIETYGDQSYLSCCSSTSYECTKNESCKHGKICGNGAQSPWSGISSRTNIDQGIQFLYDYVHNNMVSKEDKKKMKFEINNFFGENASSSVLKFLEAQRKDICHRVKDFQCETDSDCEEMYSWTQSMQKYLESIHGWWGYTVKPFLYSSHLTKCGNREIKNTGTQSSQSVSNGAASGSIRDAGASETFTPDGELSPEYAARGLALCGPYPEPIVWFPWAEGLPRNPVFEFYLKLAHISSDNLIKVLESMRLKTQGSSRREMQEVFMDRILRSGADKFTQLMEKNGILWEIFCVTRPSILADRLCNHLFHTINSISASLFPKVAKALGLTLQHATKEIVSRTLFFGLKDVLKGVKSRLPKRIAQEVAGVIHPNSAELTGILPSPELQDIITHVFPNDLRRPESVSSNAEQNLKVTFNDEKHFRRSLLFVSATRIGNFGLCTWQIRNVTAYSSHTGKTLSPIFEYGGLYWNVVVYQKEESFEVAIYQAAEVHCALTLTFYARDDLDNFHQDVYHYFSGKTSDCEWKFPLSVRIPDVTQIVRRNKLSHDAIDEEEDMAVFDVRIGILANESEVSHLTKSGWEGQYNFCRTPAEAPVVRPTSQHSVLASQHSTTLSHTDEISHKQQQSMNHDAAELARRELEKELEDEQRKRNRREQQRMSKIATTQIKTNEVKLRREIENEYMNRIHSMKEDASKEITRLHRIRKQREKIPKLLHSLQQQQETIQRKIDDISVAISEESDTIIALSIELERIEREKLRCTQETERMFVDHELVSVEIDETLKLIDELQNVPSPAVKRSVQYASAPTYKKDLLSSPLGAFELPLRSTGSESKTRTSREMFMPSNSRPSASHHHQAHNFEDNANTQFVGSTDSSYSNLPLPLLHPALDFVGCRQRPTADVSLFESVIGSGLSNSAQTTPEAAPWKSWSPI